MSQDDWKFTAPTDLPETVKAIILKPMLVDGIYGLGCSPDNGITNRIYWTIYGRKYYQEDGDRIWPFIVDKVRSFMSLSWDDIQGKPVLVTKDELDQRLSNLDIPSTDGLAKQTDLDNVKATADSATSKAEQAQSTADANTKALQNVYTKEEADQKYWTAEQGQDAESNLNTNIQELIDDKANADDVYTKSEIDSQNDSNVKSVNNIEPDDRGNVNIDLTGYAKTSDIPKTMGWSQIIGKPNLALSSDIPSLDGYAKLTDIPSVTGLVKETELSDYVRKSDIPKMPDLSDYAKTSEIPTDVVTHAELTTTEWLDTGTTWLNGNTGSIQYRSITIGNYHIVEVKGSMYITTKAYAITSAFKIPLLGFEDSTTMHFSGGSTITNEIPVAFMAGDPGEVKLYTWQNVNNGWTEVHLSWTYVGG